jgi:hypothetical protein
MCFRPKVSLLQGCQRILLSDGDALARQLQNKQTNGAYGTGKSLRPNLGIYSTTDHPLLTPTASSICPICSKHLFLPSTDTTSSLVLIYLCGHAVHATCALPDPTVELPDRPDTLASFLFTSMMSSGNGDRKQGQVAKALGAKLAYAATVRVRVRGCPVCHKQSGKSSHGMGIGNT